MSLSKDQFGGAHTIEHVTVHQMADDHFKVKIAPQGAKGKSTLKSKTFKGESAWSDAQRHANDALVEQGHFFGPQFML